MSDTSEYKQGQDRIDELKAQEDERRRREEGELEEQGKQTRKQ
jgi:hypothetical protein